MSLMVKQEFIAELSGCINNQPIALEGSGTIDTSLGITSGKYLLKKLPDDFDPIVLGACLVTGYPNVCATSNGIENPFGNHQYEYERYINFQNGGKLHLRTKCDFINGKLDSRFYLTGHIVTPTLDSIEPIIESWIPGIECQVDGNFVIAWRCKDKSLFIAEARTKYKILADVKINHLLHRYISLVPQHSHNKLSLYQDSHLFFDKFS
ncbi:MAG: hypothetical protein WA440_06635 [Ignavibacteriaceae bacterium]